MFVIAVANYFELDLTVRLKREELVYKLIERKNILVDVHQAYFALW